MILPTFALAAALSLVATPVAAPGMLPFAATDDDVVVLDTGIQDVRSPWFEPAVIVPGDGQSRTADIVNGRSVPVEVTVEVTDTGAAALDGLFYTWPGGRARAADVVDGARTVVADVEIAPGQAVPLTLGYELSREAVGSGENLPVTFSVVITAQDVTGAPVDPVDPSGPDDPGASAADGPAALPATGGVLGAWWLVPAALFAAGLLALGVSYVRRIVRA